MGGRGLVLQEQDAGVAGVEGVVSVIVGLVMDAVSSALHNTY